MSLVAYGDSDCESDEDNCIVAELSKSPSNGVRVEPKVVAKPFLTLPQPKCNLNAKVPQSYDADEEERPIVLSKKPTTHSVQEKKDDCPLFPTLPKPKTGGKVKIIIPSLNEFYDEDDDYQPKRKMIKPSNNGCGLFSVLPVPSNKRTVKASTTISMVPRATMRKMSDVKVESNPSELDIKCFEPKPTEVEEEEEVGEDDGVDFLGLNKINEMPDVAPIAGFDIPEVNTNTTIIEVDKVYGPMYCPESSESDIYEENETKLILDSNALKQLGDRDKTSIKQVDVINVNMSEVLGESQQWLQKNLTEEYAESKNVGSDINITGQSKRKHQITYLAQQAKANELKLKNMWAENRMTRKQTQAKYGF